MILWLISLPSAVLFCIISLITVAVSVGGLLMARPIARKLHRGTDDETEFVGSFLQATSALYGILLGLVVVAVWSDYKAAEDMASREGAALGAFYADVSGLHEPLRGALRAVTAEYVNYTIDVAWPAQRLGENPLESNVYVRRIQGILQAYEPDTAGQTSLHAEALRKMNEIIELRRTRAEMLGAALPSEVWGVVLIGAFATLAITWLMPHDGLALHVCLESLLAMYLALSFFILLAFDRPLVGTTAIDAAPYVLVRDRLIALDPP